MSNDHSLQKAKLYYNQQRFPEAEREVRQHLSESPDEVYALFLLAEVLSAQHQHEEALEINSRARGFSPNDDEFIAQRALILFRLDREPEAIKEIQNAIVLNPVAGAYRGVLGELKLATKDYKGALEAANIGLGLNPEDTFCLNVRARALVKLEKPEEALSTIATSLEYQPENSYTHANLGWSKLETGRAQEAQEHFAEALRLQPNFEYAQRGMMEAIKAKNFFYRQFLRYVFWMNRLTAQYQWAFIIGIYLGYRVVSSIAENNPDLAPFLNPILYAYIAFALSTWFFEPISNLFLFLHPYGKFLLKPQEKISARLVGALLAVAIVFIGLHFFSNADHEGYLFSGIGAIAMMIPLSSMFAARTPKDQKILVGTTMLLGALWVFGVITVFLGNYALADNLMMYLFIGIFLYQWLAIAKSGSRY
jgi:tetratricopeptide (TPR) repeat protein